LEKDKTCIKIIYPNKDYNFNNSQREPN